MQNTKILADKIVSSLTTRLSNADLPGFKSVYICGSYCRGDWLNCNSDLDIHMVYNDCSAEHKEHDLEHIKSIVSESINGQTFFSHTPNGIDYGFSNISNIPKTFAEACRPSPYAYFSTLMYDFKENHITVYGDEINDILPESPNPKASAREWLLKLTERAKNYDADDFRLQWSTYKTIIAAQLHHGEVDINKYKILELYQKHVPDFSMKWFGELIIRNYVGSIYPDRVPVQFSHIDYIQFIDGLAYTVARA